jgi:hypothetical protein
MLFAVLAAPFASAVCDIPGVHVEFGSADRDLAQAYYDSAHDSGSHYIVFTGSFMPRHTGDHTFTVTCTTYFTSALMPATAHLEWDELPVKYGKDTWNWTATLTQDFRYSYKCTTDDNFYYATLQLDVTIPGGAQFTVNTDYSDTCTVVGCRNLSYTRDDNCLPPSGMVRPRPVEVVADGEAIRPVFEIGIGIVAVALVVALVVVVGVVVIVRRRRAARLAAVTERLLSEEVAVSV